MYLEDDIKTKVISGTRNPEFNYERRFTFEQCTPKVMILHPDMNDWYFEETKVTICSLQIPGHINLLVAVGNFRERLEQLFCRPFSLKPLSNSFKRHNICCRPRRFRMRRHPSSLSGKFAEDASRYRARFQGFSGHSDSANWPGYKAEPNHNNVARRCRAGSKIF